MSKTKIKIHCGITEICLCMLIKHKIKTKYQPLVIFCKILILNGSRLNVLSLNRDPGYKDAPN